MKTMQAVSMLSLCVILLGCATTVETEDFDPAFTCNNRVVTLNYAKGYLAISQEYIEICIGKTLTINIVPKVPNNGARTSPSRINPNAGWLNASVKNGRFIEIQVPPEAEVDEIYKFDITIDDIGMLDPRVRVVR